MTQTLDHRPRRNPIAWGVFLATSWTWCIGMFLPVLLVHDFGFLGWLVFAVPNVIGAGAMGWVLRDAEQSRRMVEKHRAACVAFSLVTILFHLYFASWVLVRLTNPLVAAGMLVLAMVMWLLVRTDKQSLGLAIIIYLASLLAFVLVVAHLGMPRWDLGEARVVFGERGAAWLFPVCCLGFLTCPYLDLTFHAARQATSRVGAKIAFGVGFGLFFLLMILFTLWYAGPVYQSVFSGAGITGSGAADLVIWLVVGHMLIQSAFTVAIHARAIYPKNSKAGIPMLGWIVPLVFCLMLIALRQQPSFGKDGYLLFMSFYALVAPAYFCCHVLGVRRVGLFFLIPVILATPFYWLGFLQNWTIWLLPGVGIVLIAWALARYSGSRAASARSESLPARQESTL